MHRTSSHLTVKVGPYTVLPGGVNSVTSSARNNQSLKTKSWKPSARQSVNFHSVSTANLGNRQSKRKLSRTPTPPPLSSRSHYIPRIQLPAGTNNSLTPHSMHAQSDVKPSSCSSRSLVDSERQPSPLTRRDLKYLGQMGQRKDSTHESGRPIKNRGSLFKVDKKCRNQKVASVESQSLERELARRSGVKIQEEERTRLTNYTKYEETIRRLRKENYVLQEEIEMEKKRSEEKERSQAKLKAQLEKTKNELKELSKVMEQCFGELKNPVYHRYRGLRELKRRLSSQLPESRIFGKERRESEENVKIESIHRTPRKEKERCIKYDRSSEKEEQNSMDLFSFDNRLGGEKEQLQQLATINQEHRMKVQSGSSSLMSTLKVITDQLNEAIHGENQYKSAFPSLSLCEDDYVESFAVQPLSCPQNRGTPKFKSFLSNCPF